MRFVWLAAPALLAVGAGAQTVTDDELPERCETTDCFNQRQIRNFEIVDEHTLIVYVGARECPFLVELTGAVCDVTFLPGFDIVFTPARARSFRSSTRSSGIGGADLRYARVCAGDLSLGIEQVAFGSIGSNRRRLFGDDGGLIDDRLEQDRSDCRVGNVESLTDDEILEIYVDNRFASPPPPLGTGQVKTIEGPAEEPAPADPDGR